MSAFRWSDQKLVIACQLLRKEWQRLFVARENPAMRDEIWILLCELTVELQQMRGEISASRFTPVRGAPVDVQGPGWKPIVTDEPPGAGLFLEEAERPE